MIVFKLTMPRNNSWNGKWSGDDDIHIIAKPDKYVPNDRIGNSYYYDFGDGWCACIDVIKMNVNSNEYRQMTRKNRGFCGYEWMVESIIENNEIRTRAKKNERLYRSALRQEPDADQHRPHIGSAG